MKYLLDTNIVSEPLRPAPNAKVMARLKRHSGELAIASELWFGCLRLPASTKRTVIERYLTEVVSASMAILPYDQAAAEWHARERARLVTIGQTPPFVDGQIMAIAQANGLILVTLNPKDYAAFAGVKVEDWSR